MSKIKYYTSFKDIFWKLMSLLVSLQFYSFVIASTALFKGYIADVVWSGFVLLLLGIRGAKTVVPMMFENRQEIVSQSIENEGE